MNNCEKVFKRIESPMDFKEGVSASGIYIIEKAKAFGSNLIQAITNYNNFKGELI